MSEQINQNLDSNRNNLYPEWQRHIGESALNGTAGLSPAQDIDHYEESLNEATKEAFDQVQRELAQASQSINLAIHKDGGGPFHLDFELGTMDTEEIAGFMVDNNLLIDNELAKDKNQKMIADRLNFGDLASKEKLGEILNEATESLAELKNYLALNVDYQLGNSVIVHRNQKADKPAYLEDGWNVGQILANGQLRCISPDGEYRKDIKPEKLEEARRSWEAGTPVPES